MQHPKSNGTQQRDAVEVQVFDNLKVEIIPNGQHRFLMSSLQVAEGYGVSDAVIRMAKKRHADELVADVHYLNTSYMTPSGRKYLTAWTQVGIIRLGFFIKSPRAKRFRDWAERYIADVNKCHTSSQTGIQTKLPLQIPTIVAPHDGSYADLLEDLLAIESKTLRLRLARKFKAMLEKGGHNG